MVESLQTKLYQLQHLADTIVISQLTHLSLLSVGVIFLAGLLTSLTPCMVSMLPLTIGYIGGYEAKTRVQAAVQSTWFALGLATTLAALGLGAALLGNVYGQVGIGLPIIVSVVAILMGLNLLEALPLPLPAFDAARFIPNHVANSTRSYLLGLTFGLVASPCSTPVLATLLAWVSTTHDPLLGAVLLLAYTAGYSAPLIIAGTFTATLQTLLAFRRWSAWITPASGAILVGFGVFSLLSRLSFI
ncbi:MAG: cytochrome c biogenesis protein CcdA [Cyanobacteria bacterium]|nr:cytochrome c biogenesis protein CcdA [Cyanobacteriota bacterium]MDW8202127.1 cytochrome c biogenesis protein CcdA [Cyanobacteriota bacterium SKYGB_h_bin112]